MSLSCLPLGRRGQVPKPPPLSPGCGVLYFHQFPCQFIHCALLSLGSDGQATISLEILKIPGSCSPSGSPLHSSLRLCSTFLVHITFSAISRTSLSPQRGLPA